MDGYKCMNGSSPTGQLAVTYNNERSDDYLTPTSPVSPQPPKLPAFPASFGQSQTRQNGVQKLPIPRADSGIESDYPRTPTSSTSTSNPRNSTLYEYIDPDDIHINGRRPLDVSHGSRNQDGSSSSGVSSVATGNTAATTAYSAPYSDSEERAALSEAERRRVNPMYEALEKSATRLYAQTCHCKAQSATQKHLRYLWIAVIIMLFISTCLIGVIAYMLLKLIPGMQSHLQLHADQIKKMESDYATFSYQSNALHQILSSNTSDSGMDALSTGSVVSMVTQLNNSVNSLHLQLDEVGSDLQQQIHNVSLMPQNVPAAANLSACYSSHLKSGINLPGGENTTPWLPATDVLQENFVMSASCGVKGGTFYTIEVDTTNASSLRYRCRCNGQETDATSRYCHIFIMICPRRLSLLSSVP